MLHSRVFDSNQNRKGSDAEEPDIERHLELWLHWCLTIHDPTFLESHIRLQFILEGSDRIVSMHLGGGMKNEVVLKIILTSSSQFGSLASGLQ